MDLIDSLTQIASRAHKQLEHITTEEATKNALVMPVINALGYNVFDPTELVPEFTADLGVKKGEKVDYALMHEGKPMILIECKAAGSALHLKHASQLFRYFSVTEARFAILTNGIDYRFYTDIEAPNKMDEKPFFEFSMLQLDEAVETQVKKFAKGNFDLENILSDASELKYKKEIMKLLAQELDSPSEDFVKHFTVKVTGGRFIASVKEQFTPIVRSAFRDFIKDRVNDRIKTALDSSATYPVSDDQAQENDVKELNNDDGIETTEEEREAFHIVKAILSKHTMPSRIVIRDTKSYCGVLLDDNNRKPICRLHFNYSQKYLGVFDRERKETKIPLQNVHEIYEHEERIVETLALYTQPISQQAAS